LRNDFIHNSTLILMNTFCNFQINKISTPSIINKFTLPLFLFFICGFSFIGNTQSLNCVRGKIVNVSAIPLPLVNISLFNSRDSLISGSTSDDEGNFGIKGVQKGFYYLRFTHIGIEAYTLHIELRSDTVINTVVLHESLSHLQEVTVTTKKATYEQKIDRLVINVKNNISSAGGTALELLEKLPNISIDRTRNTLYMNGKSGLSVMINGKISRQPLEAIVQMLNGLKADAIEKIEIITNPSAKYEASGNAGIVNIILTKGENLGTNGDISINLAYGLRDKEGYVFNINHRNNTINVYSNLSYSRNHTQETIINQREIKNVSTYNTQSFRNAIRNVYNAKIGIDYQASKSTLIGGYISGSHNNWNMEAQNIGYQKKTTNSNIQFYSDNKELNVWKNIMINLNVTKQIDSTSVILFDIDYLGYDNNNPTSYSNIFTNGKNDSIQILNAKKNTPISVWALKFDYSKIIKDKFTIDLGVKGIHSDLTNSVNIQNDQSIFWVADTLNGTSSLKERIGAIYTSIEGKIDKKTDFKAGLRYEHTLTNLSTVKGGNILDLNYGNFFPTFFLSRVLSENTKIIFSYGKRITRPAYSDLAPFIIFIDPSTYFVGNLALQKSLSDNINLNFQWKKSSLTFEYNYESDAISTYQPIVIEGTGNQAFTSINLNLKKMFNVTFFQQYKLKKWLEGNVNIMGVSVAVNTKNNINLFSNYLRVNINQVFNLTKTLSMELTGFYQTKSTEGVSTINNYGNILIGVQKKFSKDKKLSLTFNNILGFKLNYYTAQDLNANYFTSTDYNFEPRIFNLTYSYIFGNKKLRKAREYNTGAEDIKSRIN
jgi:hypothetical protein